MSLVGNIYEDLRYQWVKLVGLIFTAQDANPFTGGGKPRFWVKTGDKKPHFTDTDGNDDVLATKGYVDGQIGGEVPSTRTIGTTAPLTGGGDLSANRTLVLSTAAVTNGGAGNAGKVPILDGAGKLAGRVVETDGAKLDTIDASAKALDATAGDIAPLGPAKVAGAVGKAADAGHVHQADKGAFRVSWFSGVDASGGASHVVIAALKVGDQVLAVLDVTAAPAVDGSGEFEGTVTVNGQLQQPANNDSAKRYVGFFIAKS